MRIVFTLTIFFSLLFALESGGKYLPEDIFDKYYGIQSSPDYTKYQKIKRKNTKKYKKRVKKSKKVKKEVVKKSQDKKDSTPLLINKMVDQDGNWEISKVCSCPSKWFLGIHTGWIKINRDVTLQTKKDAIPVPLKDNQSNKLIGVSDGGKYKYTQTLQYSIFQPVIGYNLTDWMFLETAFYTNEHLNDYSVGFGFRFINNSWFGTIPFVKPYFGFGVGEKGKGFIKHSIFGFDIGSSNKYHKNMEIIWSAGYASRVWDDVKQSFGKESYKDGEYHLVLGLNYIFN